MTNENLREIQELLGYSFRNTMLLQQAFIRRSYSQEHPDSQNNEILEFLGDSVLHSAVARHLADRFGDYTRDKEFSSKYREGKLTTIKQKLISKAMLAHRIDILGFNQYLIMGKGDIKNNVQDDDSVKEDLFEAILGAVALDSSWNLEKIDEALLSMLPIDDYLENGFDIDEENYVQLVQEWCQKTGNELPIYLFTTRISTYGFFYNSLRNTEYCCTLRMPNLDGHHYWGTTFEGRGNSKPKARMDAARQAYEHLEEHDLLYTMQDLIGEAEFDKAINQLQELAHKGFFSLPTYDFREEHDKNGNPIWYCECHVAEYDTYYWAKNSSKKIAKKKAALSMLQFILDGEDDDEDDDDWYDED